jgi:hypothetical protein
MLLDYQNLTKLSRTPREDELETQSTARFDTPPIKKKAMDRPRDLVKDICKLIRETIRLQSCLYMVVDTQKALWRILSESSLGAESTNDLSEFVLMTAIVEALQKERLYPSNFHGPTLIAIKERRVIAILLSHILLHFCGSAWLREDWDKGSISFLRHNYREQMVLSTNLQIYNPDPDLDALKRMHRFPAILSLGILLMELELKKTFEFSLEEFMADLEDDGEREDCRSDANTKQYVAISMLKELRANQPPESDFITAIDTCINFHYTREVLGGTNSQSAETDDIVNHRDKLYSEISLRRKIYQEIVVPLERDFCKSFKIKSSELLEKLPIAFSFWDRRHLFSIAPQTYPDPVLTPPRSSSVTPSRQSIAPISSVITDVAQHVITSIPDMQPIYFHDVPLPVNAQR